MPKARNATSIVALLATLAIVPLTGCFGNSENDMGPTADLKASDSEPWKGEAVTFDGQGSTTPNGEITTWRFDFGDGSVYEADNEDEARLQHAYLEPGVYTAILTVEAKDGDDVERDSTSREIQVGDRFPVQVALVKDPANLNSVAQRDVTFTAGRDASSYAVNLTVTGRTAFGSSRMVAEILDPHGDIIASRDVTVDAGEEKQLLWDGDLDVAGTHVLRLRAESGAMNSLGELQVHYDDDEAA